MKNKIIMSKTIYILLKVLILAKEDTISKNSDSDSTQDIPVSENNDSSFTTSYLDSVNVRNKIDEILFANMSVISESIESESTFTKAFVEFHYGFLNEVNISVTFRWNESEAYTVQYWFTENQKEIQCDDKNISTTISECTVHNLKSNTTYFFQVQANTKVGAKVDELNSGDFIKLHLTMWKNGTAKYDNILKIKTHSFITGLTILPSIETLYWTIYTTHDKADVIQSNLDGKNTRKFQKNLSIVYSFSLNMSYIVDKKDETKNIDANISGIFSVGTQYIISSLVGMVNVIFICYYLYRQCKKNNNQVSSPIITDIELATLDEMPNGLTVQFNTSHNSVLQYDSDKYVLIKITREQIKLGRLLGSGEFGKVYQGKVKNLKGTGIEIPAAVKMLRKNASSEEKRMFLEEARLMIYFRHKHVVRLLAICLDPEFPSIVLELMESGDLLQYLRDSRKLQSSDSQALRLQDLFVMCEDVARGCCYLENLRFVHRDLACRNCLVSGRDRENRVVKIGDFGLTRDIYNSDYYRKKGQGMLPIRWMAPESLVVGLFTSRSDVWSFGVIMWEITSLGEHPYIGRTNLDVIDYVRAGGRLPIPLNCPPTLYELMLNCWSPANDRPNFKLCLKNITDLINNIEDILLSAMDII